MKSIAEMGVIRAEHKFRTAAKMAEVGRLDPRREQALKKYRDMQDQAERNLGSNPGQLPPTGGYDDGDRPDDPGPSAA